jgi:NIMA (never in mitosis gene a)-related kinase 1/4/5
MKSGFSLPFSNHKIPTYIDSRNINIISYKESFYEDATSSLCIVMEYADGGDLYNKIVSYKKKGSYMPEKEVWHYFVQIVRGL